MIYPGVKLPKASDGLIKDKIPLLSFSGGIDSVYLLRHLLMRYEQVDLLYVFIGHKNGKTFRELEMIDLALKAYHKPSWFDDVESHILGKIRKVHFREGNLIGEYTGQSDQQTMSIFSGAIGAYDPAVHDSLYIGWNGTDEFGDSIHSAVECWKAMCNMYFYGHELSDHPLALPLLMYRKEDIVGRFSVIDNRTWSCETPITLKGGVDEQPTNILPCGKCRPCFTNAMSITRVLGEGDYEKFVQKYRDSPFDVDMIKAIIDRLGLRHLITDELIIGDMSLVSAIHHGKFVGVLEAWRYNAVEVETECAKA